MKWIKSLSVLTLVAVCPPALCDAATTSDVYRVEFNAHGYIRAEDSRHFPARKSFSLTTCDLVNLSLGRPRSAPVPTNEVLGLAWKRTQLLAPEPILIVFDTSSFSNLATVAHVSDANKCVSWMLMKTGSFRMKRVEVTSVATVLDNGNSTNGIQGGFLAISGKVIPRVLTATVTGALNLTMTIDTGMLHSTVAGDMAISDVMVLIPKGHLKTQGTSPIGTLTEGE